MNKYKTKRNIYILKPEKRGGGCRSRTAIQSSKFDRKRASRSAQHPPSAAAQRHFRSSATTVPLRPPHRRRRRGDVQRRRQQPIPALPVIWSCRIQIEIDKLT